MRLCTEVCITQGTVLCVQAKTKTIQHSFGGAELLLPSRLCRATFLKEEGSKTPSLRELAAKQTEGVKHLLLSSSVVALLTAAGAPARVQKEKITGSSTNPVILSVPVIIYSFAVYQPFLRCFCFKNINRLKLVRLVENPVCFFDVFSLLLVYFIRA